VHVQDAVGEGAQEGGGEQPHVAGQADEVHLGALQQAHDRGLVLLARAAAVAADLGGDARPARPVQARGRRFVGDDQRDGAAQGARRGRVEEALAYGVKVTGCTVHVATAEVDAGPIVAQEAVPVLEEDGPDELAARILQAEHRIYPRAVRIVLEGRLRREGRRLRLQG
jgi:hypothetical protein